MKALFVCAGSGGHINPAVATADALRAMLPGVEVLFVGAGRRLEKILVPEAGYRLVNLEIAGLERGFRLKQIVKNVNAARLLLTATNRAGKVLDEFKPDVIMATGNAVCYPVLKAAAKRGVPTVLHEANAVPGLAAKMVSKYVTRVYSAFPDAEEQYRKPEIVRTLPTPVRGDFGSMTRKQARRELGIPESASLVVSFFGSQGGAGMNAIMREVIKRNAKERAFWQIHAVGGDEKRRETFVSGMELPRDIDVRAYISDVSRVMAAADLMLCRAGGSTVAEITRTGRASVLVPSPFVPNDHQTPNALACEKAGAAVVVREKECAPEALFKLLTSLLDNKERLRAMEENALRLGCMDAAERLAAELILLAKP